MSNPPAVSWNLVGQGQTLMQQGLYEKAEELLARATTSLGEEPRVWIQYGICLLEENKAPEATLAFEQALQTGRNNPAALMYGALAASDQGLTLESTRLTERAQAVCPGNQILPTLRALQELRAGRPARAMEILEVGCDKPSPAWNRPELAASSAFVSRLLVEAERYLLPLEIPVLERSEALEEAPVHATLAPPKWGGLLNLDAGMRGWWAHQRGKRALESAIYSPRTDKRNRLFRQAIELTRRAGELDPHLFRCHYHLGEAILFAYGRSDVERSAMLEALDCFQRSWQLEGANPYLNYYLARCNQMLGRLEAAVAYYMRAIKVFTKLPEAHFGLAQCHLLLGQPLEARRWMQAVTRADLQMARDRLADLSFRVRAGELPGGPPELPRLPDVQVTVTPEPEEHDSLLEVDETVGGGEENTSGG